MKRPVVLIIRDGWGYSESDVGNAVRRAQTPHYDYYVKNYPHSILEASGEAVGLLPGFFGNSEVNHLNMGAGRVVEQDVVRIHKAIDDGSFFKIHKLRLALERSKSDDHTLHMFGILQTAAVHAHTYHLEALLKLASEMDLPRVVVHLFTDGRDSPPRDAERALKELESHLGRARIGTICGRYFLDRGGNYELTKVAYETMVRAHGVHFENVSQALVSAYTQQCPDGSPMTDEYIPPSTIGDFAGIKEGDTVLCYNFRQDRTIQITKAFTEQMWGGPEVYYVGMTKYFDEFDDYILKPLSPEQELKNILGEVISKNKLRQCRIADSQKFRHVTSFFNGKRVYPFTGEDRVEVALPHPDQYSQDPGMGAREIAEIASGVVAHGVYDFVLINFANCDNVGHTMNENAIIKAVEIVDECTDRVVQAVLKRDGVALVTADHGNAEQMFESDGRSRSAHSSNPVECFYIANNSKDIQLRPTGIVPDIAPTVLEILGIEKPSEMTAGNLLMSV